MDSGQGQRIRNARELTEEIDRATDVALGNFGAEDMRNEARGMQGGPDEVSHSAGMTNEKAQILGQGAIFGGVGEGRAIYEGREVSDGSNESLDVAAVELSEDLNRIQNAEEFVGVASEIEKEEYARRDEELAKNEADPGRSREAEIEYRSQEAVAKGIVPGVNAFLTEKKPELSGLLDLYRTGRDKTLRIIGHPIGEGN